MRNGRTIAAEREKPLADSERMQERKRQRKRKWLRSAFGVAMVGVLAWLMISGVLALIDVLKQNSAQEATSGQSEYILKAEIIDETGAGVSANMRTFVTEMEKDLAGYGYELERAVLPEGKMRQVNLYLEGHKGYIKVRSDRGTGVQAEDIDRMIKYLGDREVEYIDVRVERKGYFK